MIRLIASDVDGTILRNGSECPSGELFELVKKCRERGILFAVASGRQYPNLRRMFAPVKNELIFAAENGAVAMYKNRRLFSRGIKKQLGGRIIRDILAHEDHELLLCCEQTCYLQPKSQNYADEIIYKLGNTVTVVKDAVSVDDEWLKISAYVPGNRAAEAVAGYAEKWREHLYVAMAGPQWVDFGCASKGTSLRFLQSRFDVGKDEILAIGDNFNDIEMFLAAGLSYSMSGAAPQVRQHSTGVANSVEEVLVNLLADTSGRRF